MMHGNTLDVTCENVGHCHRWWIFSNLVFLWCLDNTVHTTGIKWQFIDLRAFHQLRQSCSSSASLLLCCLEHCRHRGLHMPSSFVQSPVPVFICTLFCYGHWKVWPDMECPVQHMSSFDILHLWMPVPPIAVVWYIIGLLPHAAVCSTSVHFCNGESLLSLRDAVRFMDEISEWSHQHDIGV